MVARKSESRQYICVLSMRGFHQVPSHNEQDFVWEKGEEGDGCSYLVSQAPR